MPENYEVVDVFNTTASFLGEGLELPGCLPWIFKISDIANEKAMFEKVKIIHGIMRRREVEKVKEACKKH